MRSGSGDFVAHAQCCLLCLFSFSSASRIYQLFVLLSSQYAVLDTSRTPSWACFLTVQEILHPEQSLGH